MVGLLGFYEQWDILNLSMLLYRCPLPCRCVWSLPRIFWRSGLLAGSLSRWGRIRNADCKQTQTRCSGWGIYARHEPSNFSRCEVVIAAVAILCEVGAALAQLSSCQVGRGSDINDRFIFILGISGPNLTSSLLHFTSGFEASERCRCSAAALMPPSASPRVILRSQQ